MNTSSHDRLLIVDFGSQVTQLIARRLRELNVYCEIHPFQKVTDDFLTEFAPKAVIFSGGPASVFAQGAPMPPKSVFTMGVPILGICYGQQVMMHCLGGKVERGHGTAEFGEATSPKLFCNSRNDSACTETFSEIFKCETRLIRFPFQCPTQLDLTG